MDAGKFYGRHNAVDDENQLSDSSSSCAGSDEESSFSPDELKSSSDDDEVSEAENDDAEHARQCQISPQLPQCRIDEYVDNWTSVIPTNRQHAFTGKESIAISKRSGHDFLPHEIYLQLLTDDILDMIVEETNVYAAPFISNTTVTRKYRANMWHPTTREEIKKFLAIVMCMGVVWMPNIHSYWSNKGIYLYKYFPEYLLENKTYYCGTLRKNCKHCPKVVTEARVKTGSIISRQNEKGVKVLNWRDKRNVLMLSTIPEHSSDLKSTGRKNRKGIPVMKPQPVIDYNAAKKGVDMSDQMASYQTALRKTRKWYRKVAFELLTGITVVNAWVLYQKLSHKEMSILKFKEAIIAHLLDDNASTFQENKESSRVKSAHTLTEAPGSKRQSRKRCRMCYDTLVHNEGSKKARASARKVNTFCVSCEDQPYLCLQCFNVKHS
ncbi:PiggyBac transposable element-derived protein [Trinorchestia longiramus]|nr:PiggyBac transposable element-derived protein [Trinorchestia longiramus]